MVLKRFSESFISVCESVGGLIFLSVAMLGFLGGYFFMNILPKGEPFRLFSAGTIIISNVGIFFKVGAGLFSIFMALSLMRISDSETEKK